MVVKKDTSKQPMSKRALRLSLDSTVCGNSSSAGLESGGKKRVGEMDYWTQHILWADCPMRTHHP